MTYNEYANLFLEGSQIPCLIHHMSGGADYRFKVYYPWELGQTIPNNVTTLTPREILTPLYGFDGFLCEMSANHAFIMIPRWEDPTFDTHLCWIPTNEVGDAVHYIPPEGWIYDMATVSDNEVYIIVEDYIENVQDIMRLQKITFTDNDVTTENIYSWEYYDIWEGSIYGIWDNIHTLHVKYGAYDCIYLFWLYMLDEGDGFDYVCRSIVYNIATGQVFDNWVKLFDYNADLYSLYYQHTTATIHNNLIVFGVCCENGLWDNYNPPYYPAPQIEIVMVDIINGNITILNNILKDPEYWYIDGGALDYTNNKYYFSAWYEANGCSSVYSVNLNNPIAILDEEISLPLSLAFGTYDQGHNRGYLFDEPSSSSMPGMAPFYDFPNLNYIDEIYLSLVKGWGDGGALYREMDMDNNIVWNLQLDKLEGKSLNGGISRDIPIEPPLSFFYPIGGPPFNNWNRMAYLRILDGKCIVLIYSRTDIIPYEYSQRWYLLE